MDVLLLSHSSRIGICNPFCFDAAIDRLGSPIFHALPISTLSYAMAVSLEAVRDDSDEELFSTESRHKIFRCVAFLGHFLQKKNPDSIDRFYWSRA